MTYWAKIVYKSTKKKSKRKTLKITLRKYKVDIH